MSRHDAGPGGLVRWPPVGNHEQSLDTAENRTCLLGLAHRRRRELPLLPTPSQRISESCVTVNIIVTIMKWRNCVFSVITSGEFLLLWIDRREDPESSTNEWFDVVALSEADMTPPRCPTHHAARAGRPRSLVPGSRDVLVVSARSRAFASEHSRGGGGRRLSVSLTILAPKEPTRVA
jgi:hypothetical protein